MRKQKTQEKLKQNAYAVFLLHNIACSVHLCEHCAELEDVVTEQMRAKRLNQQDEQFEL